MTGRAALAPGRHGRAGGGLPRAPAAEPAPDSAPESAAAGARSRPPRRRCIALFLVAVLLPISFSIGSLALSPARAFLLLAFVPLAIRWLVGRGGAGHRRRRPLRPALPVARRGAPGNPRVRAHPLRRHHRRRGLRQLSRRADPGPQPRRLPAGLPLHADRLRDPPALRGAGDADRAAALEQPPPRRDLPEGAERRRIDADGVLPRPSGLRAPDPLGGVLLAGDRQRLLPPPSHELLQGRRRSPASPPA